jgi:hypothetical protein
MEAYSTLAALDEAGTAGIINGPAVLSEYIALAPSLT